MRVGELCRPLEPRKIRVNSINPGVVITEGVQAVQAAGPSDGDWVWDYAKSAALGRTGTPADIARSFVICHLSPVSCHSAVCGSASTLTARSGYLHFVGGKVASAVFHGLRTVLGTCIAQYSLRHA
jgi:NAD(P)-dependent dehydrogenase (short-subunit alcohol dehydrogenase family)